MKKTTTLLILIFLVSLKGVAQVTDTIPAQTTSNSSAKQFAQDTLAMKKVSPLDIADDRGIYILTKDGNMQLRILGSVRFALNDDFVILPVKKRSTPIIFLQGMTI